MLGVFCYLFENNYDCLAASYQFREASPPYDVPAAQFEETEAIIS